MKTILIVEDDQILGESLQERLNEEGYQVMLAENLAAASSAVTNKFDLLILDLNLPDGSGMDFAKTVRKAESASGNHEHTPIIFLTAMNTAEFRLEGFEIGAEDYIPKPFHLKELLLRIEKVFKNVAAKILTFESQHDPLGFSFLDEGMILLFKDGRKEFPQKRDYDLLRYLFDNSPRIITREEILAKAWNEADLTVSHRIVDNSIVRIRDLLGSDYGNSIRSVRGQGYQWL